MDWDRLLFHPVFWQWASLLFQPFLKSAIVQDQFLVRKPKNPDLPKTFGCFRYEGA